MLEPYKLSNPWLKNLYSLPPSVNDQARDRGWRDKGSYSPHHGGPWTLLRIVMFPVNQKIVHTCYVFLLYITAQLIPKEYCNIFLWKMEYFLLVGVN